MPKFTIEANEQVYYRFEIEADDHDQAADLAREYYVTEKDIYDAEHFTITDITEQADK